MSLIINIENYEAFYLDYLEGVLSIDESNAFEEFLSHNRDLVVGKNIVNFSFDSGEKLEDSFINELKVFDRTATITIQNINLFLIAKTEGILSATKKVELKDFLAKNKEFQKDEVLFSNTILAADLNQVYANKTKLKRGFVIPMFAKFIAIAAAVTLIFFTLDWNSKPNLDFQNSPFLQSKFVPKDIRKTSDNVSVVNLKEIKESRPKTIIKTESPKRSNVYIAYTLVTKEIKKLDIQKSNYDLEELNLSLELAAVSASETNDYDNSFLSFDKMKNPIPIVTNTFSERLKTEVDFRSAKVTKDKQGGFLLKIGKFQISKKKSADDNLALN
jgi:hypothetical protein